MVLLSAISGTGKTNVAFIIEVINIAIYVAYAFITAVLLKAQPCGVVCRNSLLDNNGIMFMAIFTNQ